MQAYVFISFLLLGLVFQQTAYASENHGESQAHGAHGGDEKPKHADEHGHHDEQATRIDDTLASQVKIETVSISSQVLQQRIVTYGNLSTGPEQLSHVRARYTGMIKSVKLTIGDYAKRGDLLAKVESNESLKTYQILAPISGTIIQRHANTGEVTQDQVLFSIANFDTLWAEFRIYPSQQSLVKTGQPAHIVVNEWALDGTIQHIIPALDKPYQLARVIFDNRGKGLSPGLLVEGHIVIDEFTAKLAVEKNAVQILDEKKGVFVKQADKYTFTPLQLGRSDERYVEVISGISSGQIYVSKNSYLIKADIEKSAASHDH
ncbi:Probable Co/Zn/Cd efflux system membrane fusion protein [hydrothermal vent metagenome]|uniref:Probable Co/Zn/Cd efflux system membrane fusion protein n=1 Tax=hydrothermal vent metagenome TaxID=652676 RepID=A0A3B0W4P1_9ZZZZ